MKPIHVGIMGVGTVGGGTATVLKRNAEEISRRAGRTIALKMAANLDVAKARELVGDDDLPLDGAEVAADLGDHRVTGDEADLGVGRVDHVGAGRDGDAHANFLFWLSVELSGWTLDPFTRIFNYFLRARFPP